MTHVVRGGYPSPLEAETVRVGPAGEVGTSAGGSPAARGSPADARVVLVQGPDQAIAVEVSALPASPEFTPRLPSLERVQWEYIHAVLESCRGNVSEAARQLGIHRQSLQRMLRRHPPSR
jgi:DNA-binding NtrC family response regulator